MKSEWTKAPNDEVPNAGFDWPQARSGFVSGLAEIAAFALIAFIIVAFLAWNILMPSIGFLWLVGWL